MTITIMKMGHECERKTMGVRESAGGSRGIGEGTRK
jgi:hypothetical protein